MAPASSLQQAVNQIMVAKGTTRARFESTFDGLDLSEFDRVAEQPGLESAVPTRTTTGGGAGQRPVTASAALLQVKAREARQREQELDEEAKLQASLVARRSFHSTPDVGLVTPTLDAFACHSTPAPSSSSVSCTSSLLVTHALVWMHRSDQTDERWSRRHRRTAPSHPKSQLRSHPQSRTRTTTPKKDAPPKKKAATTKPGRHSIRGKR